MITSYYLENGTLHEDTHNDHRGPLWIDLLDPTPDEIEAVENLTGIDLPSLSDMQEIEISSRLYEENGAHYMTLTYVIDALGEHPKSEPLTFVLAGDRLVTLRYGASRMIAHFAEHARVRGGLNMSSGAGIMEGLLENIIDWFADVLEYNNTQVEAMSQAIFSGSRKVSHNDYFKQIGKLGERNSMVQEGLVSLSRVQAYLSVMPSFNKEQDSRSRLKTLDADIRSLLEHAAFVSSKLTFLLDATLGLVNIEQNQIIKIFSVAAVVFMPPTLVASIYGMNFKYIPELQWHYGYPFALAIMVVAAIIPCLFFAYKGWLK